MRGLTILLALPLCAACTKDGDPLQQLSTFRVDVVAVNGTDPPSPAAPLPANRGDVDEVWDVSIEARSPTGELEPFDGVVRLRVEPGTMVSVGGVAEQEAESAIGRNVRLVDGRVDTQVVVTGVYGRARLWVEDLGYQPAAPGSTPACANGVTDDDDVLVDFPNDPGCAFANDDSEEGGTYAAGVSPPVHYSLPRVVDIQGDGSATPYPFEGMEIKTDGEQYVVVTRVTSDGFYVTDLTDAGAGANHLFAFNFSTPAGMRICSRVTYLAGTVSEFFGFTELTFPSYRVENLTDAELDECLVPPPAIVDEATIEDDAAMELLESGLVRIEGFEMPIHFGPEPAAMGNFGPNRSNCDLNGDGTIDFENNPQELACSDICTADPFCTEWTSFAARGNYTVHSGMLQIQINTNGSPQFDPLQHKSTFDSEGTLVPVALPSITGTLRNFSGGDLNWTVEARCADDIVCPDPSDDAGGCLAEVFPNNQACVREITLDDNDQASN